MDEQRFSRKYRSCPAFSTLEGAHNYLKRGGGCARPVELTESVGTYLYRAAGDGFATGSPLACVEPWVAEAMET